MKKISVIVIGAGTRGYAYTKLMVQNPDKYEVVGVADPDPARRERLRSLCNIPVEHCYA